ncbi:MAG: EF-hand domain-containing protein [Rhodobacteraceae bacterium]|nr:EF-hand domain-containing protein [Paracoccaceae bacterium]
MKQLTAVMGAIILGLAPGMAEARTGGAMPAFDTLDRDGSGSVTFDDFEAALAARPRAMQDRMIARLMGHADDDGRLDEDALRSAFEAMHADRAGAIPAERRDRMRAGMFERIDANDDGVIDADEYTAFMERRAERMQRRGLRGQRGHGSGD